MLAEPAGLGSDHRRFVHSLHPPGQARRPGPKGLNKELIDAIVEMKHRNPGWARIAQRVALAFGVEIDKDVVRRIPSAHYRPESDGSGPCV